MLVSQWTALAAMSFILTLVWTTIAPKENVYVTAGLSLLGWGACALTAPALEVASGGELLAAGAPTLSFVSLAFAALSALAVLGYRTGHYPPDPADEEVIG
jgi:hypothetical protein